MEEADNAGRGCKVVGMYDYIAQKSIIHARLPGLNGWLSEEAKIKSNQNSLMILLGLCRFN